MNSKIGLRELLIMEYREIDGKYDRFIKIKEDTGISSNVHLIEISKGENGGEKIVEEITSENIPKLMNNLKL